MSIRKHTSFWWLGRSAAIAGMLCGLAGCATGDYIAAAHKSLNKAFRIEEPSVFFEPVLARATGDPAPPPPSWQARQYYLSVIFNLQSITPRNEPALKREGTLGDAFVLKTLAQWRLGRIEDARASALRANASGQEALDATDRALFRAFQGVVQLEAAFQAYEDKKPFEDIQALVSGENGAWQILGRARTELTREVPLQRQLILSRLAAYKVLRDARARSGLSDDAPGDEDWKRTRAQAEIELHELAELTASDPGKGATLVRRWSGLCGLALPVAT